MKRTKDLKTIQHSSHSVGATLAAIGSFKFEKLGRLEVEENATCLAVGPKFIEGPDQIARLMDTFLASANCERRAGPKLIQRLHDYAWSWSSQIPDLGQGFVEHGGQLPDNWKEIVRVIDLSGLIECLTHDELPIEAESVVR